MNKQEIVKALEDSREPIMRIIDELSDEQMLEPGVVGEWTLKDLIAHLTRWEAELIKLLWQIRQGGTPSSMLVEEMDFDAINARWNQEDQSRSLGRILEDFYAVREQTLRRLEYFNDRDLDDPNRYPFLKGKPLWIKIAGNSFAHDQEHLEQIQRWLGNKK